LAGYGVEESEASMEAAVQHPLLPGGLRYRVAVKEYEAMAGVFPPDARLELIEGEILAMSPTGWKHVRVIKNLTRLLSRLVDDEAQVSVQNPIVLSAHSEPLPDVALLRPSADEHEGNAEVPDIWLLIEVSDSTLPYDLGTKLPLYARHGVPEVWVIDVDHEVVRQFLEPVGARYDVDRVWARGTLISATALPGVSLAVDDILRWRR
jgi:Uma2 family endonuclease